MEFRYKETLPISIVQMDCALNDVEANAEFVIKTIENQKSKSSLIVFPELCLTGYSVGKNFADCALRVDSTVMQKIVKATKGTAACVGFIEETDAFSFYNSLAIIYDGDIKSIHKKVYLPNYGIFEERKYFSPGTKYETVMLDNFRLAPFICGDAWNPAFVHLAAADLANVIVLSVCSPEGGLGSRLSSKDNWKRLVRMYATLYGCYVIFVNRVGKEKDLTFWGESEVIDPFGATVVSSRGDDAVVLDAELNLKEVRESRITINTLRDEDFNFLQRRLKKVMEFNYK